MLSTVVNTAAVARIRTTGAENADLASLDRTLPHRSLAWLARPGHPLDRQPIAPGVQRVSLVRVECFDVAMFLRV